MEDIWTTEKFESWLRVGIESYVLENAGASAFPSASSYILQCRSLPGGLQAFAEDLNAKRLDAFKHAIAQVLSSLEPREKYVEIVKTLLAISVAASASPVLKVLAGKIGKGFFGKLVDESSNSLFTSTLDAVARMSTPDKDNAIPCLQSLVESEYFEAAHASTALIAMCNIEPENIAAHLNTPKLRPMLLEQIKRYDDEDGNLKKQIAFQILEIIGIKNLAKSLEVLKIYEPNASCNSLTDDWLIDTLQGDDENAIDLKKDEIRQDIEICYKKEPAICALVKNESKPRSEQKKQRGKAFQPRELNTKEDYLSVAQRTLGKEINKRLVAI